MLNSIPLILHHIHNGCNRFVVLIQVVDGVHGCPVGSMLTSTNELDDLVPNHLAMVESALACTVQAPRFAGVNRVAAFRPPNLNTYSVHS